MVIGANSRTARFYLRSQKLSNFSIIQSKVESVRDGNVILLLLLLLLRMVLVGGAGIIRGPVRGRREEVGIASMGEACVRDYGQQVDKTVSWPHTRPSMRLDCNWHGRK